MVSSLIDFFFKWYLTCWLAESCKEHGDQRGERVAAEHKGESTNLYEIQINKFIRMVYIVYTGWQIHMNDNTSWQMVKKLKYKEYKFKLLKCLYVYANEYLTLQI